MKREILTELALQQVRYECSFPRGEKYKGFAVNDDMAPALRYCCFKIEAPLPLLKSTMKELRNEGLVELVPTVDCDGDPSGSGWVITDKGMRYAVDNELITKDGV